jgi:hypothetical protein
MRLSVSKDGTSRSAKGKTPSQRMFALYSRKEGQEKKTDATLHRNSGTEEDISETETSGTTRLKSRKRRCKLYKKS